MALCEVLGVTTNVKSPASGVGAFRPSLGCFQLAAVPTKEFRN